MVYTLHHDLRDLRDDAALHRDLVHNVTHLLLSNVQPVGWLGERGLGWLDSGIAHYFEAAMCGGICATLCHHEHSQPPLRFRSGKWLVAARQLLAEKRLPRVGNILGANTADLTPEEHVLSFALVSHLIAVHGGREMGELIRQAKRGVRPSAAMRATFGFDIDELDDRLRSWLRGVPRRQSPASRPGARRPHVALYVYTREFVRPRHAQVVRMAIARRAEVHTSGFAIDHGKPVRRLGPVNGNVRHWRGDRNQSKVGSAWPFAAVLEFEKTKGQRGYLDWFRRKRGSTDPGAWFLDPAGSYVSHINAETVCHEDQRFCFMAVVDTPTGGVIGSNEFAVRGRVVDAEGNTTRRGWWVRFFVRDRRARDWAEELVPLVAWRVESSRNRLGIRSTTGLTMPERELAVWGTRTVFRFPRIPGGIRPCEPK